MLGIGNPGPDYDRTRHNVGFDALDALASTLGLEWQERRGPVLEARGGEGDQAFALLKPLSFVNRSGPALAGWARATGWTMAPAELLVVVDDVALDVGRLRLRAKGRAGGHNGLRSLNETLGDEGFARLRVGVGAAPPGQMVEHVLGQFDEEQRVAVDRALEASIEVLRAWLQGGEVAALQNTINRSSLSTNDVRETGSPRDAASAAADDPAARSGGESDSPED